MTVEIQTIIIVFMSICSFLRARHIFNQRDERILQQKIDEAQLTITNQENKEQEEECQVANYEEPSLINLDQYCDIDNQIFFYQYDFQRNFQKKVNQDNAKRRKLIENNTFEVMGKYSACKKGQILTNDSLTPPYNQQCFEINPFKRERRAPILVNFQYEPAMRHHLQRLQADEQICNPIIQQTQKAYEISLRQQFATWASLANHQFNFNCPQDYNKMKDKPAISHKKVNCKARNISKRNYRPASLRLSETITKRKSSSINNDQSLPFIILYEIKNKEEQLLVLKRLHASFIHETSE